jgi:hypothetical protein
MDKIDISDMYALIDRSVLERRLIQYKSVSDKISQMIKTGELIPIMRGKYISGQAYKAGMISRYQIANTLYGPSYVSGFTALYFYGWIPERVISIESATTLRSKSIDTKIGRFEYQKVNVATFHIGISYIRKEKLSFLLASPTKALIDVFWMNKVVSMHGLKSVEAYLFENLRIDEFEFAKLDVKILDLCIKSGPKKRLLTLVKKVLKKYQNGPA